MSSVLLHDIGTPPFGHLFEYHLRESAGWNHEDVIESVLWGHHARENTAHQFFAGRVIEFRKAAERESISVSLIQEIVGKRHCLSGLLFGSLDLDNLDNVARMTWALGMSGGREMATSLASRMTVRDDGQVDLANEHVGLVREWMRLRRAAYEVLVFDPATVAAQAVLSWAIGRALAAGIVGPDDWVLTDEELLVRLLDFEETKSAIAYEYLGTLPAHVFAIQLHGEPSDWGAADRKGLEDTLAQVMKSCFPDGRPLPYVFVDRGTFEKQLEFASAVDGSWSIGEKSRSVVLYGFLRNPRGLTRKKASECLARVRDEMDVRGDHVVIERLLDDGLGDGQQTLSF